MSKTETAKPVFQVLAGDAQQFIQSLMALREKFFIKNQWISTNVIQVTPQDYAQMVNAVEGDKKLIAAIPKAQTVVMISGLFEVTEKPVKKQIVN